MNTLTEHLAQALETVPAGVLWVGFSGGLDSSVLLHALAAIPLARERGLTALHVCHGLQPEAASWAEHAGHFATVLGLPFRRVDVVVSGIAEEGVEAAARRARYAAFAQHLPSRGNLVLAHHRDDQVETLLLRLLHGAGHEGLAGMRVLRSLSRNDVRQLWRPLLDRPRAELERYAREHGLDCIDDPSNLQPTFTRNRLRHGVLPTVRAAFPDADTRIAAAARRLREEADALDLIATDLLDQHLDAAEHSLACAALRSLPPALTRRLIGAWLDRLGLPRPPPGIWPRILPELIDARPDAEPVLAWRGARLRRHRDALHADENAADPAPDWSLPWDGTTALVLPDNLGTLVLEPPLPDPRTFVVRPRRGGEMLLLRGHQRRVKTLLQEAGVAPWQRARLPLLFDTAGTLQSIAGRWNSDPFQASLQATHSRLRLY